MNFLKNYISSLLVIAFAALVYQKIPFYYDFTHQIVNFFVWDISVQTITIFYWIIVLYIIVLIPYYLIYPMKSKARLLWIYLYKTFKWESYDSREQVAFRAIMVKLFFVPLMVVWLTEHIANMTNGVYRASQNISLFSSDFLVFFNTHFFWTAFNIILFVDVLFFTLGYLIEIPKLKNTIKSVEPTIIGWLVVLLCYPPINTLTGNFLPWFSNDFPQFQNMYVHIALNLSILVLMAIYAWASWSLKWKASNLTNRGIISHGPYKYIRHPAYACKNIAWLIGWIPMIYLAMSSSELSIISVVWWLGWWAFLYYMRAITEENHLSLDPDYVEYKNKVKYKFIPRIW